MKFKSIQIKIALITGICLFVTAGILISYNVYFSSSSQKLVSQKVSSIVKSTAIKHLEATASYYSKSISQRLEKGLNSASTLAKTASASKAYEQKQQQGTVLNRDVFNNMLMNVLKSNPDLNGAYSCWAPNAFDQHDMQFKNGMNGNNLQTGRYTPYWTREPSGKIEVQPLVEYDSEDIHANGIRKSAWYQIPRQTHRETVTAPLPYVVQGKRVWLATLSVPILVHDKFLGVVGTDYNLDFVQKLSQQIASGLYNGQAKVMIITGKGHIIADSEKPEFIGQSVSKRFNKESGDILEKIQSKQLSTRVQKQQDREYFEIFAPISLGNTGEAWSIMIRVDQNIVFQQAIQLSHELEANNDSATDWQIFIGSCITLIAIITLFFMAGNITKPILAAVEMAKTIATGQFNQRLNYKSQDEIGQLSASLDNMADSLQQHVLVAEQISQGNLDQKIMLASDQDQLGHALSQMVDNLNQLISQVKLRSGVINQNADAVSGLSQDLAQGATESASSITEISATISQTSAQIKESSLNAEKASHLSQQSLSSATKGSQLMEELQLAMTEIETSGQDINAIIQTIESIAEQTNLLALNAAIEAARAGQYGRGFAVVADEVRQLAARSAEAVKKTSSLIEIATQRTSKGTQMSQQTTEALREIVANIEQTTELMNDIAQAAGEQASGAEQMNLGILQIDEVTHQNSANSENCAHAAHELTEQAEQMNTLITQFRLKA